MAPRRRPKSDKDFARPRGTLKLQKLNHAENCVSTIEVSTFVRTDVQKLIKAIGDRFGGPVCPEQPSEARAWAEMRGDQSEAGLSAETALLGLRLAADFAARRWARCRCGWDTEIRLSTQLVHVLAWPSDLTGRVDMGTSEPKHLVSANVGFQASSSRSCPAALGRQRRFASLNGRHSTGPRAMTRGASVKVCSPP